MLSLVRMELLKLSKRPMTWVLNILLLGGLALAPIGGFLAMQGAGAETRASIVQQLTMPGILLLTSNLIYIFGSIMLAILAASSIGSEYSWGTLRPMLVTGIPRGRFLAAKLLALAVIALSFVVTPLLLNGLLSLPIAISADAPLVAGTVDLAWFGKLFAIIGRTYLLVMVPALIAFMVSVVSRSQAAGIGAALGILIGEQVVTVLLTLLGAGWTKTLIDLFPGRNSAVITNLYNRFDAVVVPAGSLGEGRVLLTLAVYALACLVVAFLVFRRRDIRGAA